MWCLEEKTLHVDGPSMWADPEFQAHLHPPWLGSHNTVNPTPANEAPLLVQVTCQAKPILMKTTSPTSAWTHISPEPALILHPPPALVFAPQTFMQLRKWEGGLR